MNIRLGLLGFDEFVRPGLGSDGLLSALSRPLR